MRIAKMATKIKEEISGDEAGVVVVSEAEAEAEATVVLQKEVTLIILTEVMKISLLQRRKSIRKTKKTRAAGCPYTRPHILTASTASASKPGTRNLQLFSRRSQGSRVVCRY